jgi:hypothetical protein
MGGGRKGIGKERFWEEYSREYPSGYVEVGGDKFAKIGYLDSKRFPKNIKKFVEKYVEIKKKIRLEGSRWHNRIIKILSTKIKSSFRQDIREALEELDKRDEKLECYNRLISKLLKKEFGLLDIPEHEKYVIAFLFAKLHEKMGFPTIKKISDGFPDAIVKDKNGKVKRIEFEMDASNYNHSGDCDYIVCWRNDLGKEKYKRIRIISLEEYILKYFL